jgi:hypothetical protein
VPVHSVSVALEVVGRRSLVWFPVCACKISMRMCGGLVLEQEPCVGLMQLSLILCHFLFDCVSFCFCFASVFPIVHVDGLVFDSSLVTPLH